ncbi:MAG: hypothetical protein WBP81_09065 [Solirubrobacteraceae bacterium]
MTAVAVLMLAGVPLRLLCGDRFGDVLERLPFDLHGEEDVRALRQVPSPPRMKKAIATCERTRKTKSDGRKLALEHPSHPALRPKTSLHGAHHAAPGCTA